MRGRFIFVAIPVLVLPAVAAVTYISVTHRVEKPDSRQANLATGYVFHDKNRNGRKDAGEEGLPGIKVSNQREIVKTDSSGKWQLPYDDETIFFVVKPRGWMTPLNELNLPRFSYIHKPNGSPANFKFPGVKPTGPIPASIDFPLTKQNEPNRFRALMFGDTQNRDIREVEYMKRDIIEDLIGTKEASFGVTLGDIVFDDLSLFKAENEAIALIGIPWYNVIGNHDINYDAATDQHSDETYESIYGPSWYSFDYGPTHFIVLDDVKWIGKTETANGRYLGGFDKEQLEFVKNDLAMIPNDQLVVLMMHIPLVDVQDRQELYRLIEKRPYALSIAAHTHYQEHRMIKKEDGWNGTQPHHHVINVTVCGSWWSGRPDEQGIPHTTMRDGAPNGYSFFTFDGRKYDIEYRAARRPKEHQMLIHAPEVVSPADSASTMIQVNVFGGSEKSKVEMQIDRQGDWIPMPQVKKPDPEYARVYERERTLEKPYYGLSAPVNSPHLWEAKLPSLRRGVHLIEARTTDMFGKTYSSIRSIRVE